MSRIFQWPVVGVGFFIIATSITVGLFDAALSRNSSRAIEALEIHIRKGLEHTLANMKI